MDGSGDIVYFDPGLLDCVLLVAGRNHSTDIIGRPVAREIPAFHHDSSDRFDYRHCLRSQRSFPVGRANPGQQLDLLHNVVYCRSPATHHMSPWVKKVFTVIMPRLLLMSRPIYLCQGSCGDERKKKNQFYNGIDYSR